MKDRLISFVCLLAVLLSFAVVVSWARSMMNCEGLSLSHQHCQYFIQASDGTFRFMRSQLLFADADAEADWRAIVDANRAHNSDAWSINWSNEMMTVPSPENTVLGFGTDSMIVDNSIRRFWIPGVQWQQTVVQIPHWFVILLIGGAPAWWLMRRSRIQRRRARLGLCLRCGFEMGSLYHSCPRCGQRAPLPEGFPVFQLH